MAKAIESSGRMKYTNACIFRRSGWPGLRGPRRRKEASSHAVLDRVLRDAGNCCHSHDPRRDRASSRRPASRPNAFHTADLRSSASIRSRARGSLSSTVPNHECNC
jgi:hypothetical protein